MMPGSRDGDLAEADVPLPTQLAQAHLQLHRLVEQHQQLLLENQRLLRGIAILLHAVADQAECKGCPATIYWVRHKNGKSAPYNVDGTNHFVTCPNSKSFKKAKEIPTV
jgi:hypothetical protein